MDSFYSDRILVHSTHAGYRSECEDLKLASMCVLQYMFELEYIIIFVEKYKGK